MLRRWVYIPIFILLIFNVYGFEEGQRFAFGDLINITTDVVQNDSSIVPNAVCNVTLVYSNGSVTNVSNRRMTNTSQAFYNYTVNSSKEIDWYVGRYSWYVFCNHNEETGWLSGYFYIRNTSIVASTASDMGGGGTSHPVCKEGEQPIKIGYKVKCVLCPTQGTPVLINNTPTCLLCDPDYHIEGTKCVMDTPTTIIEGKSWIDYVIHNRLPFRGLEIIALIIIAFVLWWSTNREEAV